MKPVSILLGSLFFSLSVCGSSLPSGAEAVLMAGDSRVGTYISSWKGFRTSSYWIEGPSGLVLIDTQFLPSAAEEMVNWAEKVTGKKAQLAIILHPNPDKFNGTAIYQKRGIKVVTSDQVLKLIPAVHTLRSGWFYEEFKPDYPVEIPKPDSFGDKSTEIKAAGLTLKVHVLGKGCSETHVIVEFDKNVFVGDLVTIGFHSWLELGYLREWLKALEQIKALKPTYVRTGRGGTGDADALEKETAYLQFVLKTVDAFHPRKAVKFTEKTSNQILNRIVSRYSGYDFPNFVENGLEAVWKTLQR